MENPTPKSNSKRNIIIIGIVAVVFICCLCVGLIVVGGGAAYFLPASSKVVTQIVAETVFPEITSLPADTAAPDDTATPEDTTTPETIGLPSETPPGKNPPNPLSLGVSRDEMIQFFNADKAFIFGKPFMVQGLEAVIGTHTWVCIQTNCAVVTLLGPADDLLAVSVVVPTDPNDIAQTSTAVALLMNAASHFVDTSSDLPYQILSEVTVAQTSQTDVNKTFTNNGYEFTIVYIAQTHNAGFAIARPKW